MPNKHKNKSTLEPIGNVRPERIDWKVGITPAFDIFIHFQASDRHFECTMDEATARDMGNALVDTAARKRALSAASFEDVIDPVIPKLIPLRKPQ